MSSSNEFRYIIEKFRSGHMHFGEEEKSIIRNIIINGDENSDLQSAIYIYSYLFKPDNKIIKVCRNYTVVKMSPGLSATCYKALFRYWCIFDIEYINSINKFLHPELWDTFYDEIYFLIIFLNGDDGERFRNNFTEELKLLEEWAVKNDVQDLLDAWNDC